MRVQKPAFHDAQSSGVDIDNGRASQELNGDAESPKIGEVLPPDREPGGTDGFLAPSILALISNYTDRPDLFLAEVEKHAPGFTKRMNASAERHSEQLRQGKYDFGKRQAYVALSVSALSAGAILFILGLAVWKAQGFWAIIGLAAFYAVTQGGSFGFSQIIEACAALIGRVRGNSDKSK